MLLALAAAAAYGASDFVGGVASRRSSAWPVALVGAATAAVCAAVLAAIFPGTPATADLAWGALAGVGNGLGGAFLYRGFATGRMAVAGPVSAVGAAVLPLLVGVAGGERPGGLAWAGIVVALPAIWLVAREVGADGASVASGLIDGLIAGAGFGLLFAAMGQVPAGAGFWPVVLAQVVSVIAVAATAAAMRAPLRPHRIALVGGPATGGLSVLALLGFTLAVQHGLLTLSGVLTSLYPAVTILLAAVLLGERIERPQLAGLALCGVSVVCIAVG